MLHLTHWQKGRDWYDDQHQNHKVEDDHPEALPIWWERNGSEADFAQLLEAIKDTHLLTMPFTNWTVWNTTDPVTHDIPTLSDTPAAATNLRGEEYPFIEYQGYMVEPWATEVRDRNTRMFQTYTDVYPQDLMFVDMTGERSWRYVAMNGGATASAAAYTQGVVDENLRLSQMKPLFTEGVFDRIGGSVTGYAQTLRQKLWNHILAHLGNEYEQWTAYPFAADVLHDKVAFYQHDLNSEVWPGESRALATYYSLFGYNSMVDVTKHLGEDEQTIWGLDAMQKSVNARTFGQRLLDDEILSADGGVRRTTWGPADDPLTITANFDVGSTGQALTTDGYEIAPDGFLARSGRAGGTTSMVAGMFRGTFAGSPLAPGVHWITVERGPDHIEVKHPIGDTTFVRIDRPSKWVDGQRITVRYVLADETAVTATPGMVSVTATGLQILMPPRLFGHVVRSATVAYGRQVPDPGPSIMWQVDAPTAATWQTVNAVWGADATMTLALDDPATTAGKTWSEPVVLRLAGRQQLSLSVSAITADTHLLVQVQEAFGDYRVFDAADVTEVGDYTVDLDQLLQLRADGPYTVVLWLEGAGSRVECPILRITGSR